MANLHFRIRRLQHKRLAPVLHANTAHDGSRQEVRGLVYVWYAGASVLSVSPNINGRERSQAAVASQQVEPAVIEHSDDDEEEELRSYEPIDLLQDAGINATDIAKLKEDGYATIGQLFQVSHKKLLTVKGISEAKVDKVRSRLLLCLR